MDILFWSGGKDSYLALEFYRRTYGRDPVLLTTYNEEEAMVPIQNIPLKHIRKQAAELELELVLVPLPADCPNEEYLSALDEAFEHMDEKPGRLVFGDWKNEELRAWREKVFGERGYECIFPIWQKSIHQLLPVLLLTPVKVKISAVAPEYQAYLRVGELYDQRLVSQLPSDIDPMGENGEFHTEVTIYSPEERST